ncbi:CPBP family intramembrane metalloprotease [Schaalia sp. 19OD2882]|uniref:type II CAAX endopeptidase family protein n=1 Tax=Schaalia sp. 19OD2882 TaxID=2794089 RepID=UPI001C1EE4F3|nr:type II CAAX endopeptidase family protein [Schaalia sp. 19OD2882]QWW19910.1 CPBP family intramembrane metalloprotease [Schaalia sp. 19OD2882]
MESLQREVHENPFRHVVLRLGLMAVLLAATWGALTLSGKAASLPPSQYLYFPLVNIVCAAVLWRVLRKHGVGVWEYFGFRRGQVMRDIAWGLLWLVVAYVPMIATLMTLMFALYGTSMFGHFEQVFAIPELPVTGAALAVLALVNAVVFLVNAPVEEMIYRGWLQSGLAPRTGAAAAVVVQGVLFGVQHMAFAANPAGALAHLLMFVAWGITAGIIVHKQGRLAPILVAHWIVNIALGVGPLLFLAFTAPIAS